MSVTTLCKLDKILLVVFSFFLIHSNVLGQSISFLPYFDNTVQESMEYQRGNSYQKDVLLFCNLIEETHPAFAGKEYLYPFNLAKVKEMAYQWAERCRSVEELHTYLQHILTKLNDSHTTLQPITNSQLIYPFSIFREQNKFYLWALDRQYEAYLGKQIEQINGCPVAEVVDSFKDCICSDNEVYFNDKVNGFMQLYSSWKNSMYVSPDSVLSFTLSGGVEEVMLKPVVLNNVNIVWKRDYQQTPVIRKNVKIPFDYQLLKDKGVCYLQINTCMDRSSVQYQSLISGIPILSKKQKTLLMIPRFDSFLQAMFDSIYVNGIETLIVDLRGNRGGNSLLGDVLLSYLKPEKDIRRGKTLIRFSDLWEQTYPVLAKEYYSRLSSADEKIDKKQLYDTALPAFKEIVNPKIVSDSIDVLFVKNRDVSKLFKGKVLFLQDEKTFSSAGLLLTLARDNGIGTIIGSKSAYAPCCYGDVLAWELPNTKIRGFVSHKLFVRANEEACDERCLSPDVLIPSTWHSVSTMEDTVWKWILEVNRTK